MSKGGREAAANEIAISSLPPQSMIWLELPRVFSSFPEQEINVDSSKIEAGVEVTVTAEED